MPLSGHENIARPKEELRHIPTIRFYHGTDGAIISTSAMKCLDVLKNVSEVECTLRREAALPHPLRMCLRLILKLRRSLILPSHSYSHFIPHSPYQRCQITPAPLSSSCPLFAVISMPIPLQVEEEPVWVAETRSRDAERIDGLSSKGFKNNMVRVQQSIGSPNTVL